MADYLPSVRLINLAAALVWLAALPAVAAPVWLIATPDETARAGAAITLDIVKPSGQVDWPAALKLRIVREGRTLEAELSALDPVAAGDARRSYRAVLPANLSGLVRADLAGAESNRLALIVRAADPIEQMRSPAGKDALPVTITNGAGNIFFIADEPALSANEPMYFVAGNRGGVNARFQFSFKYRFFDPDSRLVAWSSLLSGLHFGYTQSSIWDLGADSKPFRDSSYRPSVFWQGASVGKGLMPDGLNAGYEHESNGKDGANSRSINTFFVQPVWSAVFSDGRTLIIAPKVYGYLDKEDNPDIERYRGYANFNFRYGREDGWILASQLRRGTARRGSAQFDVSIPLRKPIFARAGGFLQFQLFKGYGESLLDYNFVRGTQLRVGFSIVR